MVEGSGACFCLQISHGDKLPEKDSKLSDVMMIRSSTIVMIRLSNVVMIRFTTNYNEIIHHSDGGADGSVVIASKPGLLSQRRPISSAVAGSIPAENHQGVLVGIACQPSPTVLTCVPNVKGSTRKSP